MKIVILGAGVSGLSVANALCEKGIENILLIEKENEAGGLCRSKNIDGNIIDIGGGHFLDVTRKNVLNFLFKFMPEDEWDRYERNTKISVNGLFISHPFESNIWQFDDASQVRYLKSIAIAGCNLNEKEPEKFIDWIYWKLGKAIADDYMIPYNQKIFGENLNQLGTYWLDKLPSVSFEETLMSCLKKRAFGTEPGHSEFYYPKKYGYGEVWLRLAENIKGKIHYNETINKIDFNDKCITTKEGYKYNYDILITTIPWAEFDIIKGMPIELVNSIKELKYSSISVEYYNKKIDTDAQWIYYPNLEIDYHRIFAIDNFSAHSSGYWTETNIKRNKSNNKSKYRYDSKYSYPLNTINKPIIMKKLLDWCESNNVYGLGRWGEHMHYNSDFSVDLALKLSNKILKI